MSALKTCFRCGIAKPRIEFYPHPRMGDGLLGKCKECARVDVRANRASRPEYYKAFDKSRANAPHRVAARKHYASTPQGKVAHARALRNSRDRAPHKALARYAVSNAIRDGKLKPQPCWVCGAKAQAHHPDYSDPLGVVWLCEQHHREAHALVQEAA